MPPKAPYNGNLQPRPKVGIAAIMCPRCGMRGKHRNQDVCIFLLRERITMLEFRLAVTRKCHGRQMALRD